MEQSEGRLSPSKASFLLADRRKEKSKESGRFSLLWGHGREAPAAKRPGCSLLYQVLAQQLALVLPLATRPLRAAPDGHTRPRGSVPLSPACPPAEAAVLLAGLSPAPDITVQMESQPPPRFATQMRLESPLAGFPVKPHQDAGFYPGSQSPHGDPIEMQGRSPAQADTGAWATGALHTTFQRWIFHYYSH